MFFSSIAIGHCSPCHDKEFGIDSQNLCYKDESNYTATASKKIFRVPREKVSTGVFFLTNTDRFISEEIENS